jgi:maltose alpha-D-glucosyltransferase/alpha-amylase
VPLAEGFRGEAGTWRIRVHGDFHLGQTLRTPEGDWAIIDFEGEPARPIAERRRKTSALKDVAGMLRSFSYARGEAERAASARDVSGALRRLGDWETGARRAFLEGYREALAGSAQPLAPGDDAAFTRALAAWELDKTLYEIAYEARNRPDWLALPLGGLVAATSAQPADATGAASA